MKPTRGKVKLSDDGKYIDSPDGWIAEVTSWPTSPVKQVPEGSDKHKANGRLFVAAWNAAQEINPENPIAAAEAMPEMWRLINELLPHVQREVQTRESSGLVDYIRPLRELAERIERLIRKAKKVA